MAETWVLNESITFPSSNIDTEINFTSNGTAFVYFRITSSTIYYCTSTALLSGYVTAYNQKRGWTTKAYRTVVFDTAPTGNLLTWLQANGTKQSEPEPPEPITTKNACLIDGTAYSIKRGKALIGGTGYDIGGGKTLVGGTVHDIILSKKTYTVTITGTIHVGYPDRSDGLGSYCKIGDDKYTTTGTVEAAQGTKIIVQAGSADVYGTFSQYTYIYLNGSAVAHGQSAPDFGIGAKYEFELNTNVTIDFKSATRNRINYNIAYITT